MNQGCTGPGKDRRSTHLLGALQRSPRHQLRRCRPILNAGPPSTTPHPQGPPPKTHPVGLWRKGPGGEDVEQKAQRSDGELGGCDGPGLRGRYKKAERTKKADGDVPTTPKRAIGCAFKPPHHSHRMKTLQTPSQMGQIAPIRRAKPLIAEPSAPSPPSMASERSAAALRAVSRRSKVATRANAPLEFRCRGPAIARTTNRPAHLQAPERALSRPPPPLPLLTSPPGLRLGARARTDTDPRLVRRDVWSRGRRASIDDLSRPHRLCAVFALPPPTSATSALRAPPGLASHRAPGSRARHLGLARRICALRSRAWPASAFRGWLRYLSDLSGRRCRSVFRHGSGLGRRPAAARPPHARAHPAQPAVHELRRPVRAGPSRQPSQRDRKSRRDRGARSEAEGGRAWAVARGGGGWPGKNWSGKGGRPGRGRLLVIFAPPPERRRLSFFPLVVIHLAFFSPSSLFSCVGPV